MTFPSVGSDSPLKAFQLIDKVDIHLIEEPEKLMALARAIPECLKCRRLDFSCNHTVTEEVLAAWVAKCPRIHVLDLASSSITDLRRVPAQRELHTVDVTNSNVDVDGLLDFLTRQQTLESLISNNVSLTGDIVKRILEAAPNLLSFSNLNNNAMVAKDWRDIQESLKEIGSSCRLSY